MLERHSTIKPIEELKTLAEALNKDIYQQEFSNILDKKYPLYRSKFIYPKLKDLPGGSFKL